ncbi:MAG: META domain-containing protein [Muribaculaceae bacterium]|nr:META domain-containing protein [Muribaculaceae bacterium]
MKHSTIFAAISAAILLGSCSALAPKGNTVSGSQAIKKDKTENVAKNRDKEVSKTDNSRIADLIAGEWNIVSAAGTQVTATDDRPYVTFDKAAGRFYASDGCNIINGSYTAAPDGKVTFGNVISTMKYCGDIAYAPAIAAALSGAEPLTAKIERIGQESILKLYNQKGTEVMSANKHNMEFLNGNWQIVSVDGKAVTNEEANLFIDIRELKVHGNTGCNFFNGELYINPDKSNAIDFSHLGSTRMMCPDMEQEAAILLALEETASAIQGSEGRVMLLDQTGKELMSLRKIETGKE